MTAITTTYGEPVGLAFADGPVDLGTETSDGERIVRLVLNEGAAHIALTPAEARQLGAELIRQADSS